MNLSFRRTFAAGLLAAGCSTAQRQGTPVDSTKADSAWLALNADSLPGDSLGVSIRRGRALLTATHDSLPRYAPSALRCTSCHLNAGRQLGAVALYGSYGRYPQYNARAGGVVSIEDRVNYCFTRSLAGWKLPDKSSEMRDIVAYLAFLSRGIPAGSDPASTLIKPLPPAHGDSARGVVLFAANCARCHGADATGSPLAPPLWGRRSFSIAASMAREERAAAFIKRNMPLDKPGTLDQQQAYDIAAYITSLPRTDLPAKALDYPGGKAPADVPYRTLGHVPSRIVAVFPRERPADALVPLSATVRRR
jgi:thiosulfate dehydrogenase